VAEQSRASAEQDAIRVSGARVHNLKNISFEIPHNSITVVTGVSGSGKSSLAFDTVYAEGQRRYIESLSAYARQFLERIEKPDVDEISGIAPAIAIRQKNSTRNPRSTVATATEIYDYLRLLFARVGRTYCARCGAEVRRDTLDEIATRVLALDPATGAMAWHYQHAVDHWDLDHAYERILLDAAVAPDPAEVPWINPRLRSGEMRRVVTGIPGKTGVVYTLDRLTGEFLWARPTVMQNVIAAIDGATGRAEIAAEALFTGPGETVFVCPSSNGGKNWPAGAYSPRTGTMYFPMANTCMNSSSIADVATPDMTYAIDNETVIAPGKDMVGAIYGISATTGKATWRYEQRAGVMGLLATGGDLVFVGDVAGRLLALGATTGRPLWEIDLGSPVSGHPVTFAVDGRQYVAVSTGRANLTGSLARLTPDAQARGSDNMLVVLALPDL